MRQIQELPWLTPGINPYRAVVDTGTDDCSATMSFGPDKVFTGDFVKNKTIQHQLSTFVYKLFNFLNF